MKDLEQTKKEFKSFMDAYVALMKIRHQEDMRKVKWELLKIAMLVGLAYWYMFYAVPWLEKHVLGI